MSLYFIGKPRYKITCCTYPVMPSYYTNISLNKTKIMHSIVKEEVSSMIKFMEDRKYIYKLNHSPAVRKIIDDELIIVVSLNISFDKLKDYSNLKMQWSPKHIDWP